MSKVDHHPHNNNSPIEKVTIENFFDEVLQSKVTIVDFYAEWCEPCIKLMRILPNLAKTLKGVARLVKVDTEVEKELVDIYAVKKIPTFVFLVGGAEVQRIEGRMPTLKQLETIARELASNEGIIY
jgi:thioredoxin-like negative regulator of GroEL